MKGAANLVFLIVLLAVFWFLMVLPQRRQQRQRQQLQQQLRPGVRVLTYSGFYGDVERVEGGHVYVRIAPGVVADMDVQAIARIVEAPAPPSGDEAGADGRPVSDRPN
ncbi:hypothetical protein GCM10010885_14140 [Alicyclobacillus cellulosilyticus]|uniref:Preprotein translocase subunit YajC n=1 Tax=Alicyclobacillus cellulosilyticus TaxID=1003997 RepID=A0A917KCL5_9BACL|nr:preprotein translocase subunit YajC [Alicyclobacillus cellulosilyticus]GGJ06134.1 hypothetical protein GCM10010885_14140 [Alicyclobacillus cellulosilyticus]